MNNCKERLLLYRTFGILSLVSIAWVLWNLLVSGTAPSVCMFRHITGIPCPSCGITHSVLAILQLHFNSAVQENVLGFVALLLLITVPPLIMIDLLFRKNYFIALYNRSENLIRKKWFISIPMILLVLGNWIYLISKS